MEQTAARTRNALKRPFGVRIVELSEAHPQAIYEALADLSSHAIWGAGQYGLHSLSAPNGPAIVGTEFESTGGDRMGPFKDRSVVTEARPGELFELVTDARQQPRKGDPIEWTVVHRYEIRSAGEGSEVTYVNSATRISRTPGMLRLLNSRVLSGVLHKVAGSAARAGVRNLIAYVEGSGGTR